MPTQFAKIFKLTAARNLLRQFGEEELIGYYPGQGDKPRRIKAIVVRNDPSVISEMGGVVGQSIVVTVLDDATEGISATQIDSGRDKVSVALETGGTEQLRSMVFVTSDANGFVRFLVQ